MSDVKIHELKNESGDDSWFCPQPGRYYAAMWSFELEKGFSKFGLGGDAVFQLWRFEREPDGWILLFRFRHYRGVLNEVWESADEKHWYDMSFPAMDEQDALDRMEVFFKALPLASGAGVKPDILPIQGGLKEFTRAIDLLRPAWLHVRVAFSE